MQYVDNMYKLPTFVPHARTLATTSFLILINSINTPYDEEDYSLIKKRNSFDIKLVSKHKSINLTPDELPL